MEFIFEVWSVTEEGQNEWEDHTLASAWTDETVAAQKAKDLFAKTVDVDGKQRHVCDAVYVLKRKLNCEEDNVERLHYTYASHYYGERDELWRE